MKNKKIMCIIAPLIIGGTFLFGLDKSIDYGIDNLLKKKDLVPIMNDSLSLVKDKGLKINDQFLKNGEIMMIGSSELSHGLKQHPTYYFNNNRSKDGTFIIGRAYTQSLQDSTIIGSVNPNIKDKKVVLLVSMQWFMDQDGVTKNHFQTRFSPVQFYSFLDNPKISKENKVKFINRVSELLTEAGEFKPELAYSKLYEPKTMLAKIEKALLSPYFKARQYLVGLKDRGILLKTLIKSPDKKGEKPYKPVDWNYEMENAIKDAKKRVGNNELKIDRMYFNKNFGKELYKLKDRDKDVNLMKSREFDDYQLTLDVCKELNIKPTIVMLPSMDKFYNLTGISKEERHEFYDKAGSMAKDKGYKVIDLRDKETEDYYLKDVMHLGTKGWVDVCEKLFKEFNE
ncbi:D-alanyl-lipoteichoic acid biosynthesis protein DltD [Romboutsia maritimum]|uniref:Protein DltD n=1 Tax=Romboutsia maritimum TaxID=2020948 RepID=A0A371IUW0_9FIRM|nr:D-alanyl-lipoteichoic acid biosynthesis protein DltD [Romboutsia maritimum]RDY24264.1 D-alanyl-lipoteichoic acid biosynthesis protein DltD [Romboutsia maritimum]